MNGAGLLAYSAATTVQLFADDAKPEKGRHGQASSGEGTEAVVMGEHKDALICAAALSMSPDRELSISSH
jgi:hypothetical protein